MPSHHGQPLAVAGERKAGLIPIDRFAGARAVALYAVGDGDAAVEAADLQRFADLVNHHLAAVRQAGAQAGGDAADAPCVHEDSPVEWQLGNFTRYVHENAITAAELQMMLDVAIGARALLMPPEPRLVRPPYSTEFVECRCGASDKDACVCIRAAKPIIVLRAPQGVGKSRHAEELAALLGCSEVVDPWEGEALPQGALALTCADHALPAGAVTFEVADEAAIAALLSLLRREAA